MATTVVPRRAEGVELLGEYEGSGFKAPRFLVRRADGQLVQLTDLLYLVLESADGRRRLEEIAAEVGRAYGRPVSAANVEQLIENTLAADGLITVPGRSAPELKKVDPLLRLRLRVTLVPQRVVNVLAALLRPLFWPPVMLAVLGGLVAVDVWYFGSHGIAQSFRLSIYSPLTILMIYALLILSVGWHELGHATACRYSGAQPGEIGFGIYIIWPAFYTDVTDIYSVGKGGRVRTDLGGVYFNAIFCLLAAGAYFLTRFEPILVLIVIQHALIVYQFMPFLKMDGYFVFSDLTGVPDLFSRIKPILASLAPWKKTPKEVGELKRWVRVLVTAWVLIVIPLLAYVFSMIVLGAPRVLSTAWDSLQIQWDRVQEAMDQSQRADAAVAGIQALMIAAPLAGMSVTFSRVSKRLLVAYGSLVARRKVAGAFVGMAGLALLGGVVYLLLPNGEYRPIQPDERWTAGEAIAAVRDVSSGRPSLTEQRERRLGGAEAESERLQRRGTIDEEDIRDPEETGGDTGENEAPDSTPEPAEPEPTEDGGAQPTAGLDSTPLESSPIP